MAMWSPTRTLTLPDVPTVSPSLSIRRQYSMIRSRAFCMSMGISVRGLTRACLIPTPTRVHEGERRTPHCRGARDRVGGRPETDDQADRPDPAAGHRAVHRRHDGRCPGLSL